MKLTGWGRFPVLEAQVHAPRTIEALRELVMSKPHVIARGNGQGFGDCAINSDATVEMRHFSRLLSFDPASGQLVAEAGVLLGDIIAAFLPRGWFPVVTPGTKFVSLGGAIAADVHGKNHHLDGSFRACVDWIELMIADGTVQRCSREEDPELFDWTLGGMGLTGIIVRAAIRLRSVETGWIRQVTIPAANLQAAMAAFDAAPDATYSVAWIDSLATGASLGRSLIMLGEHAVAGDLAEAQRRSPFATRTKRQLSVPFNFPGFALNRLSVGTFNTAYYRAGALRAGVKLVDWDRYFYPLDAIHGWNRVYGRSGLVEFQCVLPLESSEKGLTALLGACSRTGTGSFLTVLKRFGAEAGRFSFPMAGYTLVLQFPVRPSTHQLLERLDRITLDHGGRFYLAKDGRMHSDTFQAADKRVADFRRMREERGALSRFRSVQSERLGL